jgi:hypothetical protein
MVGFVLKGGKYSPRYLHQKNWLEMWYETTCWERVKIKPKFVCLRSMLAAKMFVIQTRNYILKCVNSVLFTEMACDKNQTYLQVRWSMFVIEPDQFAIFHKSGKLAKDFLDFQD